MTASPASPTDVPEFPRFYRDHAAFVWRVLFRLGVPHGDVDDARQDVFVIAHRRWQSVRDPTRRRAWLAGITRKVAWKHRRSIGRAARRAERFPGISDISRAPDEELARREAWMELAAFLDGLSPEKRAAFVLAELDELSRDELGDALGVNRNTAYSRLVAARRLFSLHFGDREPQLCASLVAGARRASEPSADASARNWSAIGLLLGRSVSATALGVSTWATSAVVAAAAAVVVASFVSPTIDRGSAVVTSVHASPTVAVEPRPLAPPPVAAALHVPTASAPWPSPPQTVRPQRASLRATAIANPQLRRTAEGEADGFSEQARLLVRARAALVAKDRALARRHLDTYDRIGGSAQLSEVRAAVEREIGDERSINDGDAGDSIVASPTP